MGGEARAPAAPAEGLTGREKAAGKEAVTSVGGRACGECLRGGRLCGAEGGAARRGVARRGAARRAGNGRWAAGGWTAGCGWQAAGGGRERTVRGAGASLQLHHPTRASRPRVRRCPACARREARGARRDARRASGLTATASQGLRAPAVGRAPLLQPLQHRRILTGRLRHRRDGGAAASLLGRRRGQVFARTRAQGCGRRVGPVALHLASRTAGSRRTARQALLYDSNAFDFISYFHSTGGWALP